MSPSSGGGVRSDAARNKTAVAGFETSDETLVANVEVPMRRLLTVVAILQLAVSGVAAQSQSATKAETLSLEQKTKISQVISPRSAPLASRNFSVAVDAVVPADIQVHSLPPEAEQVARQVRGFGYVVVEEQIALVDQHTRKVEIVFPRWLEP